MQGNCCTIISEGTGSASLGEVIVLTDTVFVHDTVLAYSEIHIPDTVIIIDTIIIRDTVEGLTTTPIGELTDALVIDSHPATTAQTEELGTTFPTLVIGIATGNGPFSFQWYVSTTADDTEVTPIAGATGSSYAPVGEEGGTFYYYCVASNSEGSRYKYQGFPIRCIQD